MKIAFVMLGSSVNFIGGRRVAAVAKNIVETTDVYFITISNLRSLSSFINPNKASTISQTDIDIIAEKLISYDIVCFSSMTNEVIHAYNISKRIKELRSEVFTVLGGVHATLYPNEAIEHFDSICVGEGEKPIREFLEAFKGKGDYHYTKGLWLKKDGEIIKNRHEALNTNEELNEYQIGCDIFSCQIYDLKKKQFDKFTENDYVRFNGLVYNAIWTLGCPYQCSYCSNSGFAQVDKDYLKVRYPKPEIIIKEIEEAISRQPYISKINLQDDNIIALPYEVIKEFCELYKSRINMPFGIYGIHPSTIKKEKIELLASYGMIFAKMGIQSGSENTLKLYKRNTPLETIRNGVSVLAETQKKHRMVPPLYDVIVDNPLETREDIISSLRFFNSLERPLSLATFSLRALPGTELTTYLKEKEIDCYESTFIVVRRPSLSNVLFNFISCARIPKWIFERCLRKVKGYDEDQKKYPTLLYISNFLNLFVRQIGNFRRGDFSVLFGKWGYYIWRIFYKKKQKPPE
ncbi:MAG: radical SAM protein [Oscillospiraceae bacterium]|jgi:radical SAM superfamily enzyme YgiQ (UPF0313 family)|nr:radical SAM protein [Oscillospiraceae bacterium]